MKAVYFSMFSSIAVLTVSLFSVTAVGFSNPQIRHCRISGGEFIVVNTPNDQVGVCQLGAAAIGANDLATYRSGDENPLSVQLYSQGVTSCLASGTLMRVLSLEGQEFEICFFADGSLLESSTMKTGIHSARNKKLTRALGL